MLFIFWSGEKLDWRRWKHKWEVRNQRELRSLTRKASREEGLIGEVVGWNE